MNSKGFRTVNNSHIYITVNANFYQIWDAAAQTGLTECMDEFGSAIYLHEMPRRSKSGCFNSLGNYCYIHQNKLRNVPTNS